ncbi:MAG: hypothetical protein ACJ77Z_11285, partial [Thermoleophilaceae bacterium]
WHELGPQCRSLGHRSVRGLSFIGHQPREGRHRWRGGRSVRARPYCGRDDAIHYREWFTLLRSEGWEIAGRNPINSFLTEIGRADGVERVGRRTGMYRLSLSRS